MATVGPDVSDVLMKLEKEEHVKSLHYLVDKLPEFVSAVKVMEKNVNFLVEALSDQKSLSMLVNDMEEKIGQLHIHEEHFEAITEMMQMLPRLVPMMKKVEDLALFAQDVLGDERTFDSIIEGVNEVVPLKKGAEIIKETNTHFKENKDMSPVSLFGLLRLLKDPAVQHGLKYIQSLLYVINNRSNKT